MSYVPENIRNLAIDGLIQCSLSDKYCQKLEWIPFWRINDIKPTQIDNVHYGRAYNCKLTLVLLGSDKICTPSFVSEFARIYALPTHKHNSKSDNFKRYSTWLECRNKLIMGFTKYKDNYYMVAKRQFYHCYSQYGFCSACGILRCSPVWC